MISPSVPRAAVHRRSACAQTEIRSSCGSARRSGDELHRRRRRTPSSRSLGGRHGAAPSRRRVLADSCIVTSDHSRTLRPQLGRVAEHLADHDRRQERRGASGLHRLARDRRRRRRRSARVDDGDGRRSSCCTRAGREPAGDERPLVLVHRVVEVDHRRVSLLVDVRPRALSTRSTARCASRRRRRPRSARCPRAVGSGPRARVVVAQPPVGLPGVDVELRVEQVDVRLIAHAAPSRSSVRTTNLRPARALPDGTRTDQPRPPAVHAPRVARRQAADAVTDVDHRRHLVVEPREVLRHCPIDASEIVGLADERARPCRRRV